MRTEIAEVKAISEATYKMIAAMDKKNSQGIDDM